MSSRSLAAARSRRAGETAPPVSGNRPGTSIGSHAAFAPQGYQQPQGQAPNARTSRGPSQQQSTTILYATGNWQTWNKPRNAKMIEIFCLGGGGGGGHSSYSAGSVAGGGGGASGGIVRGIIPAFLLPDNLDQSI